MRHFDLADACDCPKCGQLALSILSVGEDRVILGGLRLL